MKGLDLKASLGRSLGLVAVVAGSTLLGALIGPLVLGEESVQPIAAAGGTADTLRGPASNAPSEPVAVVAGEPVTWAELDAAIEPRLEPVRRRLEKTLAEERQKLVDRALQEAVEAKLIALEARSRGITPEVLLEQETGITSADVDAYFEKKPLRGDLSREQVEPRLRAFLAGERRTELLSRLRETYPVKILLEPDRQAVPADEGPSRGSAGAPVEIVLFSDFQCPFCARLVPTLSQIEQRYGDRVRIVFRQFPLTAIHPLAYGAAEAALCANEQGKFWQLHDALFANQKALAPAAILETAGSVGIDSVKLAACVSSGRTKDQVDKDLAAGRALGLSGTPVAFVNGRKLSGAQAFEAFAAVIDDELERPTAH